jgi:hypothetical protein
VWAARIVSVATDRPGMVPAGATTYLRAAHTAQPAGEPAPGADGGDRAGDLSWATVKPYLGGR